MPSCEMDSSQSSQAESYERGSDRQREGGMKMIELLAVKKGSTVLDLGCGTGQLTKVLAERVGAEGKVVGVDPDGERLKIARERYSANNIEYIQGDDKTFPLEQYDVIFLNFVMHWIHDKEAFFSRAYKSIKSGGCFAFTTPDGPPQFPPTAVKLFALFSPDFLDDLLTKLAKPLYASDYKALASAAGFVQTPTIYSYSKVPEWKNFDTFVDSMYGSLQGKFDPAQIDKLELQRLKEEHGDGPVVYTEPYTLLTVIITK